jgi:hypothetical protein
LDAVNLRITNLAKSTKAAEDAEIKKEGDKLVTNLTSDLAD